MNIVSSAALLFLMVGCATTMPGQNIDTGSHKLLVAEEMNPLFSDSRIQMHQFSIKNNTDEWMEFDGASITADNKVLVLVGDKISSWVEACQLEKQVADYNTALVIGTVGIAGAVVAGSSHQGTATTGAVVALGSLTALGVKEFQGSKNKIEFQKAFPEKHIFQTFTVPPGKVIQRWLMVENPTRAAFSVKLRNKQGEEVTLKIVREALKVDPKEEFDDNQRKTVF